MLLLCCCVVVLLGRDTVVVCAEESQGEIEVKDPCACESLVEFQQATMSSLEQLTNKHILPSSRRQGAAKDHTQLSTVTGC